MKYFDKGILLNIIFGICNPVVIFVTMMTQSMMIQSTHNINEVLHHMIWQIYCQWYEYIVVLVQSNNWYNIMLPFWHMELVAKKRSVYDI